MDVLKLTYATLEQINTMSNDDESGGPMWNRFWGSVSQSNLDDTTSGVSGSQRHSDALASPIGAGLDISSDVHPNDSASAVGASLDDGSAVDTAPHAEADDGTYLFKFVTPSSRVHRFQARYDSFSSIREIVSIKLEGDPFFMRTGSSRTNLVEPAPTALDEEGRLSLHIFTPPMPAATPEPLPVVEDYTLAYMDDDDDLVLITTDHDVLDAVKVARHQGRDRVQLVLQGGKTWEDALARDGSDMTHSALAASAGRRQAPQAPPAAPAAPAPAPAPAPATSGSDAIMGVIPRDMVLPAALGLASVAAVAAAAIVRFGGRS